MPRDRRKTQPAAGRSAARFTVDPHDGPYPFNLTLKGLPFPPYSCSKCGYAACAQEFDITDPSLPLLRKLSEREPYSICPNDEGPDRAELLSPTKTSWRSRVTHNIRGRTVTACMLGGVKDERRRTGTLISEIQLMRELYLRFYLEDQGPLEDLDLECLVEAPLMLKRVQKLGGVYVTTRSGKLDYGRDVWETKARRLSLDIQGERPGFLSSEIAQALDPRLGPGLLAPNRYLAVPFDLSLSLQEQWERVLPWLDELANYAYRFTNTKRPRLRSNMYRDIYIFLSIAVERRTVFSVAREIFPIEQRPSREKKVRQAARRIGVVVRQAGIALPEPATTTVPK